MTTKNSHRTAIKRKKPSAPMQALNKKSRLYGRTLDYGCGRGFDAHTYGMEKYDPHFAPDKPKGLFDVITCNFVLNVIEDEADRIAVLRDIQSRLKSDGVAYITVRTNVKSLNGCTSIGTWQGHIVLDLTVFRKGSGYTTYALFKESFVSSAPEAKEVTV